MMYKGFTIAVIILCMTLGCSRGMMMSSSPDAACPVETSGGSHALWGLWQGVIDPQAETIDFIQLRATDFHLNALPFLEPPALVNLTLESLKFNGDIIEADIGLRHPFLGLTEFTGFDVCGIFISNGSVTGFNDTGLRMAGKGDTRLLNPDGFSRWWNPAEFPHDNTMFAYKDGLLGTPDSSADFNATLNAYKYFCDDLTTPNATLDKVTLAKRGMFSAGQKNVRHYTIHMGAGLIFNYAVDACWKFPSGSPPWTAPDDFGPGANRSESWRISVTEVKNTLWNDGSSNGGDLSLAINVYDWFNAGMNTARVESPGNFAKVESGVPIGGGAGYSTYQVDITSATPAAGEIALLISVISDEQNFEGFIPGINTTSYFMHTSPVAPEPFIGFTVKLDLIKDIFHTEKGEYGPCITTNPSGHVYLCYWKVNPSTPTFMGMSTWAYSTNSGQDWNDPEWWCVSHSLTCTINTAAVDILGDVYFLGNTINFEMHGIINKCITGLPSDDQGYYVVGVVHGNALIFTYDGYPVGFGDWDNHIDYKKGTMANSPWSNGSTTGWNSQPKYTAVPEPSRLSQTRSIVRTPSGSIYFVYYSSNATDKWIRIAYNADGNAMSWNYSNNVYDGTAAGYDSARDPGLHLEADGDWHCAFILHTSSPSSVESVAYSRSTDGLTWSVPVEVYAIPGQDILDWVSVNAVKVGGQEIVVITFQKDDAAYLTFSWDAGENWQEPVQISTGEDAFLDTCVTDNGYVHSCWEHGEGADKRIQYVRAYFVEG